MTAVAFPSTLPMPTTLTMTPQERRLLSSIAWGLPQTRNLQRQFVGGEQLVWELDGPQMAIFDDWYQNALIKGGRWFSTPWAQVNGGPGVARFATPPVIKLLGHEYFSVTVPTETSRRPPPFTPRPEADLLLHFDEADATTWPDHTIHNRRIAIHANAGTIAGVSGGTFGFGARFTQISPGDRLAGHYSDQSYLTAAGNIDFRKADWVISMIVNRSSIDINYGQTLLTTGNPGAEGVFVHLYRNDPAGWIDVVCSVCLNPGVDEVQEVRISNVGPIAGGGDAGSNHLYTFSRSGQFFTAFRDGVINEQNVAFEPTDSVITPTRGFTRIGCGVQTEVPLQLIDGFDGLMDELYIAHGDGAGLSANFTPPALPFP